MRREIVRNLALLWAAGASLRLTVLALPPVITLIHRDLHATETEVGVLTALPVILLALVAVPGSLLVAKLGARRALLVGLMIIAVGGAARGLGSSLPVLFLMTFVMGCGVALSQPSLPSLVRGWLPDTIGLATATFSNGMLIGEILPVAITAPLLVPLTGGGWEGTLAMWSVPVLAVALAILFLTAHEAREPHEEPPLWWPDWRNRQIWVLGLILGGASTSYWCANAFIPDFLRAHHDSAYITAALTALNLVQLPASFLVAAAPRRMIARSWPLVVAGLLDLVAIAGLAVLGGASAVACAGLVGFSTALVFVLALALPPVLAEAGDTHRFSAAIFTVSYLCPFAGSLLGGALWDVSGISQMALAPVGIGGLMMLLFPGLVEFRSPTMQW